MSDGTHNILKITEKNRIVSKAIGIPKKQDTDELVKILFCFCM